jgi:hypothetical protein
VATERVLARADGPNVKIMNLLHAWAFRKFALQLFQIDFIWASFHDDHHAVLEDGD